MVLGLFANKIGWHKNGATFYLKLVNRVIGESNYNKLRLERRILDARFYYMRQAILYE